MNEFPCPECVDGIGSRVDREHTADGVCIAFECSNCDYSWEVMF